ncbi:peptidase inhibitor family I36 protein [Glutamicibacter mishrai]|uniref:peptidase inhibitor family I36 protein n=1 Tax=Glutamicibacter mishrai TaxID=1775880 RepID=UPI0032EBFD15
MRTKITRALLAGSLAVGIAAAGAAGASATVLFQDKDYKGAVYGADSNSDLRKVGWSKKASSVKNYGYTVTFWTGANYTGNGLRTSSDISDLRKYKNFLNGTWNDRIMSYRRG